MGTERVGRVVTGRLHHADIEAIALRVIELLADEHVAPPPTLVDAAQLARALGVSTDYVYAHKRDLGGKPLGATGDGRKPRWRFDIARALGAYDATPAEVDSPPPEVEPPPAVRRRARQPRAAGDVELLPIRPPSRRPRRPPDHTKEAA